MFNINQFCPNISAEEGDTGDTIHHILYWGHVSPDKLSVYNVHVFGFISLELLAVSIVPSLLNQISHSPEKVSWYPGNK